MVLSHNFILLCKNIRLSSTQYFIIKIPNKQELQQIAFSHSTDIGFLNLYKEFTGKPYSFRVIDTLHNPLCFRKNLSERI